MYFIIPPFNNFTHGVPIATRATRQHIRLIDNQVSGRVDIMSDIPRLSANENAGVEGVAAETESGRMHNYNPFALDCVSNKWCRFLAVSRANIGDAACDFMLDQINPSICILALIIK